MKKSNKITILLTTLLSFIPISVSAATCSEYCSDVAPAVRLVKNVMVPLFQIVIPIILILYGMLDLSKAVIAGKEEKMKKHQGMFVKRCVYGVGAFFVVTIVTIFMNLFSDTRTGIKGTDDWWTCYSSVEVCRDKDYTSADPTYEDSLKRKKRNPAKDTTPTSSSENVPSNGDGYSTLYKSSNGKTYKEFKQSAGSYSGIPYSQGTVSTSGCGPTSVAIVLSGRGQNITPADTATYMMRKFGSTSYAALNDALTHFGLSNRVSWSHSSQEMINHLKTGGEILVSVGSRPDTLFTRGSHIMSVIDIRNNNEVYVCNPSRTYNGWIAADKLVQYLDANARYYVLVDA